MPKHGSNAARSSLRFSVTDLKLGEQEALTLLQIEHQTSRIWDFFCRMTATGQSTLQWLYRMALLLQKANKFCFSEVIIARLVLADKFPFYTKNPYP